MRQRPSPSFVLSFFLLLLSFLLFSTLKLLFYYTQTEEKSPRKQAQARVFGFLCTQVHPQTVQSVCVCWFASCIYADILISISFASLTWSARERKREIDTNAPVSPAVLYGRSLMGGNYRSQARKGNRWALICWDRLVFSSSSPSIKLLPLLDWTLCLKSRGNGGWKTNEELWGQQIDSSKRNESLLLRTAIIPTPYFLGLHVAYICAQPMMNYRFIYISFFNILF